ncbi:hypothetical protein A2V71_03605 [Candidatus Berkelbacteria bacterium RBG_13_40_8]|uniref:Glycosyl transferase family 1 domain-containing protein n=1 Tax=Candidatus Berkelbacteria bacterium RBG_13_40_8 TaxID=1797467 RepID=A0A1F5DNP8_9BACT|nr:MAG: hypothetical protein A2V71_03605 [Candidatus Berkelbacteria bacterium RBG_13_40_8]
MPKKVLFFLGHFFQFPSDVIFFAFLPVIIIYSWMKYFYKKIFHLKPNLMISPLGEPFLFFLVKAARIEGLKADLIAYTSTSYFRSLKGGFIINDHLISKYFFYLTDYLSIFTWACIKYDIFELPFSGGLLMMSHLRKLELILLKICAKKVIVFGYGSDSMLMTKIKKSHKYNVAMDLDEKAMKFYNEKKIRADILRAQKYADVLIASGYLSYLGPKSVMVPIAIELTGWDYSPKKKSKIVTIVHSTNHPVFKGTRFIMKVIEKLQKNGFPLKLIFIKGKTLETCQKLYRKADIVITDVITGWYGFTACEAMALGRPVICYLREDLARANNLVQNIPIISANPDNLEKAIIELSKDYGLRKKLAKDGQNFVLRYHSLDRLAEVKAIIYQRIWDNQKINQKILIKPRKTKAAQCAE